MRRQYIILVCMYGLLAVTSSHAQVFENDAAQREKQFINRVHQIEEFFHRFNNDSCSLIYEEYKKRKIPYRLQRPTLIKSLFNIASNNWRLTEVDSFVAKAVAVKLPACNRFHGEGWFAEAICMFEHNGQKISVPMVLRVATAEDQTTSWVIAAIRQNNIKTGNTSLDGGQATSRSAFISPASNGNYFMSLAQAFDDKEHLFSYFDPNITSKSQSVSFYNAILKNQVKFLYVKEIRYHFLQVNNYIFTVEHFQREGNNAGWLINQLRLVTPAEKENFRRNLLGE